MNYEYNYDQVCITNCTHIFKVIMEEIKGQGSVHNIIYTINEFITPFSDRENLLTGSGSKF